MKHAPAPATPLDASPTLLDSGVAAMLTEYVRLANARDLDGLIALYAPAAEVLMDGRPMRDPLEKNMRTAVNAWSLLSAKFDTPRVTHETVETEAAEVTFVVPSKGRILLMRKRFDFVKRLGFRRIADEWKISLDETKNAGLVNSILAAAGLP